MELGKQIVANVYEAMMIDAEWSTRSDNGFTWWGHRLAQRVTADAAVKDHGYEVVRVRAVTDFLKDVPDEPAIAAKVAALNMAASMNAYVWDRARREIFLACAVYAHKENVGFTSHLLKGAVALQAADAHIKVDAMAQMFGAHPNTSAHPTSGPRPDVDDMLNAVGMFAKSGRGISLYGPDLESILDLLTKNGILATEGKFGLAAEFPFAGTTPAMLASTKGSRLETALFGLEMMEQHPQIGSGALMTLKLPLSLPKESAMEIATELNRAEASGDEFVSAHFLGGWCTDPHDDSVTYAAFLPTLLYRANLLVNLVLSNAARSQWAARFLNGAPEQR